MQTPPKMVFKRFLFDVRITEPPGCLLLTMVPPAGFLGFKVALLDSDSDHMFAQIYFAISYVSCMDVFYICSHLFASVHIYIVYSPTFHTYLLAILYICISSCIYTRASVCFFVNMTFLKTYRLINNKHIWFLCSNPSFQVCMYRFCNSKEVPENGAGHCFRGLFCWDCFL